MKTFGVVLWQLLEALFDYYLVYNSDLDNLLSEWQEVINKPFASDSYKDGVRDCMYDLQNLLNKRNEEEALADEAWAQIMADEYLPTIEAREHLYA